jgi:hypothetical protein
MLRERSCCRTTVQYFLMFQTLKKGDIIIGSVLTKSVSGMMLKVMCTDGEGAKCVSDVNVKV